MLLETIGDHIRAERLERGLSQKDLARILSVSVNTVTNWEKNWTGPDLRRLPRVLDFLGSDPPPAAATVGQKLRLHRERRGLSIAEAAEAMGVDPATVRKWGALPDSRQNHISIPAIARFLGANPLPDPRSPAEEIRFHRLSLGLTQRDYTARLGVSQQTVSEWERGERVPAGTMPQQRSPSKGTTAEPN